MTPQEMAKKIFNKYEKKLMYDYNNYHYTYNFEHCKQCALIAVEEILESHYKLLSGVNQSVYDYWQEVKQEINKL